MTDTDAIRDKINKPRTKAVISTKDLLNTGSTLLNLACTGRVSGGFAKGHYYWIVGDSSSGKTVLALTAFAEASISKRFKDYRLIYDNVEDGALMDLTEFFGPRMAQRIEPPAGDRDDPKFSYSAEEFYYHVDDAVRDGRPFIYLLDSENSLTSEAADEKFAEQKGKHRKGAKAAGSFGDGKAKIHSQNIRRLVNSLKKSGSILIVLSQTRDNIGGGPFSPAKVAAGGRSLKFYATIELWTAIKKKLKKNVKGKDRQIGQISQVMVKKNRQTGRERVVDIQMFHTTGIDDVGSCVEFLINEGHWRGGSTINAAELGLKLPKEKLIRQIEKDGREYELREIVQNVWDEIEIACSVKRKNRYA